MTRRTLSLAPYLRRQTRTAREPPPNTGVMEILEQEAEQIEQVLYHAGKTTVQNSLKLGRIMTVLSLLS